MKISVGIQKLDESLEGGVNQNSSILLLTDTMVDKSSFVQHMLSSRILDNDNGIYLTTSKLPSQILSNMYEHGYETKNMTFIDCLSYTFGGKVKGKYSLDVKVTDTEPALERTFEIFKKALEETKNFKFAVFDCLETFMGKNADNVASKIKEMKEVMKKTRTTCIYLLTNWEYDEADMKKICNSVDKVIYLGTIEKKLIWMNYFYVEKQPKVFFVVTATGVNMYIPKILITGAFHSGKSSITKILSERAVSVD